ncbi:MAG: ATP-binding protein [Pseudomonadota bacterium]|nr:ATP-binding protein [Pseudomonadota bacterium]
MNTALFKRPRLQVLAMALLVFPLVLWQATAWVWEIANDQLRERGAQTLNLYRLQIRSELEKFELFVKTLPTYPLLVETLADPADAGRIAAANRRLEEFNALAQTAVVYLIDTTGTVIAASNWNRPRSFVGINLDYRPYFQAALKEDIGRYFALGTTSQERGYFFAAPVRHQAVVVGVVVVKVGVDRFATPVLSGDDRIAVIDASGVVFIASDPAWQFRATRPLDAGTLRQIQENRQYSDADLTPLPPVKDYLVQSVAMPEVGWEIHYFSHLAPAYRAVMVAAVLAVLAFAIALLAGLYLAQRRALIREKLAAQDALRQAHDELEAKVRERTAELRASNECLQREIRERRQAEDELIQAGKLAALGQLSAGIAHELNQPLAAMRAYADNALTFLDRQGYAQARSNLAVIGELVGRIARITGHLKTFARKSPGRAEPVFLQRVVDYALSLMEPQIKAGSVQVVRDFPEPDVPVWGEAIRLEQVVVNLVKNALEAMQNQDRPKVLMIRIAASAGQVRLGVRDTGPGIPDAHLGQVFDPFFTTKETGEGLGLGLSISNKIVREFGGSIQAGNHRDGGAVFTITLMPADVAREAIL